MQSLAQRLAVASLCLIAGCLSDPVPLIIDSDTGVADSHALDTGPREDADADTDSDEIDGGGGVAPLPFPPPASERQTRLRQVYVMDLDGDGRQDVLLANAPTDTGDTGVYVTLGGPDARPTEYHRFVSTQAVPAAVTVASLTGGTRRDLVAFGPRGAQAFAEIHPQTGRASFGTPLVRETTPWPFVPAAGSFPSNLLPVLAVTADLTADGVPDLLLIDRLDSWYLAPAAWTGPEVLRAAVAPLPSPGSGWDTVVDAFMVDDAAGTTRYLAVLEQFQHITFFALDPVSGVAQAGIRVATGVDAMGVAHADLDGDARDEIVAVSGLTLSALRLAPPEASAYAFASLNGLVPDEGLDGVAALDIDANGAPEIILLDDEETQAGPRSQLLIVRDAYLGGSALRSPWSVVPHLFPIGTHPALMAVGRFDDDDAVEVFLYTREGETLCRKITTALAVEGCP